MSLRIYTYISIFIYYFNLSNYKYILWNFFYFEMLYSKNWKKFHKEEKYHNVSPSPSLSLSLSYDRETTTRYLAI